MWAVPFLDRFGTMLKGWVAIAPAGVANWGGPWEYTHKTVRQEAGWQWEGQE
jgi:abhydrolase domain-containing protein 14